MNLSVIKRWLDKAYYDCTPYLPPVRLDVITTTACNTKCAYCWWQEQRFKKQRRRHLKFDAVAKLIDELCSLNPPKLNLTGGEPTIWPDLEKLLIHAKQSGIKSILLCTNGRRLADFDFFERIVKLGITAISLSIDTLDPDKFKYLRGYDFSEVEKTLFNCILLKKKYPHLLITLASVVSRAVTPQELSTLKRFCNAHDFEYFMQGFDRTRHPWINKKFMLSPKERKAYNKELPWLAGRVGEVVKREKNPLTEADKAKCYKGITTVKLFNDGSVKFCWRTKPVGNILKNSFMDIWTSPKAKRVRRFIRDKRCRCDFDCDIYESVELYEDGSKWIKKSLKK